MSTILDKIVASKRKEIEQERTRASSAELEHRLGDAPAIRDFRAGLESPPGKGPETPGKAAVPFAIIAEVKKASPSAGIIRADFEPAAIARIYEHHGAACLSVLTDRPFFQGQLSYLSEIRSAVQRPLLRKDFILDRYQLLEARLAGADAVLLIAEILEGNSLAALVREIESLGMQALVEFYDPVHFARVIDSGARLIGINNRNLRTFETRLEHTLELAGQLPADCLLVSESGIRTREDILRLQAAGVKAVLIGETLMRASDIGAKLDELRGST